MIIGVRNWENMTEEQRAEVMRNWNFIILNIYIKNYKNLILIFRIIKQNFTY